jgi:hypothetical protein
MKRQVGDTRAPITLLLQSAQPQGGDAHPPERVWQSSRTVSRVLPPPGGPRTSFVLQLANKFYKLIFHHTRGTLTKSFLSHLAS